MQDRMQRAFLCEIDGTLGDGLQDSRNAHVLNNFVPLVALAMLSNMDFQATLTKDATIEHMTKCMTKSGQ